ncbi:MAG: hypothetical protein DRJ65_00590 [Acidobacteria bacterium]|nr:MAG: hypothetical protein DRJ65_00590 [Acidobacteriota bacterium]
MKSRTIIRWTTATLLASIIVGLSIVAGLRVRQKRPSLVEMAAEQVLGNGGDETLGVYNEFKILERVQGKLVFALEALRTFGKTSGWHEIESVAVQLYNDDESKGPRLTCRQAMYNVDTKNANLSGSVQVEFPDGTFLSTEVGTLLGGGRRFETSTNVVFVGDGLLGSAGAATYNMKNSRLELTKGVVVRMEGGDSMVAPELVYQRDAQKLALPQGGTVKFGGFTLKSPKIEVEMEEGNHPAKISLKEGVSILGHDPESGQDIRGWSETLVARKDPAGRWQITARSSGPWVRFTTVGGRDVVFQEILAWEIRAVAGAHGLLNVRADGRTCFNTIPLEGPTRAGESDSVRVWFDQGAATDMELLDDVVLHAEGIEATAYRARLDAESGKVMLHGNPTGAQRVVVRSDLGRMTADQAILFRESGKAEIRGRVQGEMFEAKLIGTPEPQAGPTDQPVHIAAGILTVTDKATRFELRDNARMWQGQQLLTADQILYGSETGKLEAKGHVRTTLPATAVDMEAASGQDIVLSSRSMRYDDVQGKAVYVGDVVYSDPDHHLEAGRLEVILGQEGQVEQVIATGAVTMIETATGQTLSGNQAIRNVSTGVVLLTGEPAKAVDSQGNMLSGRSLTWDQPSGRVLVSEETETIYHTEEEF